MNAIKKFLVTLKFGPASGNEPMRLKLHGGFWIHAGLGIDSVSLELYGGSYSVSGTRYNVPTIHGEIAAIREIHSTIYFQKHIASGLEQIQASTFKKELREQSLQKALRFHESHKEQQGSQPSQVLDTAEDFRTYVQQGVTPEKARTVIQHITNPPEMAGETLHAIAVIVSKEGRKEALYRPKSANEKRLIEEYLSQEIMDGGAVTYGTFTSDQISNQVMSVFINGVTIHVINMPFGDSGTMIIL